MTVGLAAVACSLSMYAATWMLHVGEFADLVLLDPAEEVASGPIIGHPSVLVADRRGEKLKEAPRGVVTGTGNHDRHRERTAQPSRADRRRGLHDRRHVLMLAAHVGSSSTAPALPCL